MTISGFADNNNKKKMNADRPILVLLTCDRKHTYFLFGLMMENTLEVMTST
jgi:hypothetical protein